MYLDGLDGLDQKIVRLLIENARISYSDIGEKVGISRVAVKTRIQALEQRGIIEEYTTVIILRRSAGRFPAILKSKQHRAVWRRSQISYIKTIPSRRSTA